MRARCAFTRLVQAIIRTCIHTRGLLRDSGTGASAADAAGTAAVGTAAVGRRYGASSRLRAGSHYADLLLSGGGVTLAGRLAHAGERAALTHLAADYHSEP